MYTYTLTQLYEGVKRATGYVSPAELASYDIVLVTYEALRTEFYHATSQEVSWNLRHRKRYVCYPSPLPAVHWWRVSKSSIINLSLVVDNIILSLSYV